TAGVVWKGWEAELRRREAEDEKQKVEQAERDAKVRRDQAVGARDESRQVLAGVMLDRGVGQAEQGEVGEGLLWMLEALRAVPDEDSDLGRAIRTNLAAWSGQLHGLRHVAGFSYGVHLCAIRPDGSAFVTTSAGGVQSWDLATGRLLDTHRPGQGAWLLSPD